MRLALLAVSVCSAAKASFVPTAELPDLLTSNDGSPVKTAAQWSQRRDELKVLLQDHILGTLPTGTPALLRATAINTTVGKRGISSCYARLAFRANATTVEFDIELAWPTSATEPLPLVLTQWNHRSWAMQGVQRGYMMVLYPGADTRDASGAFRAAYPEASMRKIMARAFVASRTLDALLVKDGSAVLGAKLPAIDASRVTITGHSRNGKQSLIAAAFDERITAVVGSSPGTPVSAPVRFSSPDFNGETTKYVTDARDWWLPSLHSYLGREHELPADGHMILALVAPRHAMLATARSDGEGDVSFADEQNILANRPVWKLLTGSEDGIRIKWREGRHHGFDDPQTYFDWFDFAGSKTPPDLFATTAEEELPHAFNWSAWRAATASSTPPPPPASAPLAERVNWMLGSGAETATTGLGGFGYCESGAIGSEWDYKAKLMMHDSFRSCRMPSSPLDVELSTKEDPPLITTAQQRVVADDRSRSRACPHNVTRISLSFGAYITASLFVPCATARCEELEGKPPIPTVIFLHGYSYQLGFTGIYGLYESETDGGLINALVGAMRRTTFLSHFILKEPNLPRQARDKHSKKLEQEAAFFAGQQGVAVLAWDLTGHGARQTEGAASFYRRYKHASRLGAMVGEVQSAMDFIHCSPPEAFNTLPECSDGEFFTGEKSDKC
jgi:hypothetical protein